MVISKYVYVCALISTRALRPVLRVDNEPETETMLIRGQTRAHSTLCNRLLPRPTDTAAPPTHTHISFLARTVGFAVTKDLVLPP
jgi:hypothetical protein